MTPLPATPPAETISQRVAQLLGRWREETLYLSDSARITGHPAYQELIALGPAALPALFRDMEQTGGAQRGQVRFFHRLSLLLPDHCWQEDSRLET